MKFLKNRQNALLLGVVILGYILRFIFLDIFPTGLHRDEAYLGYNAYSILVNGKDISGNLLPLHLESFLYSPAGYAYTSIPFIYFFGLSEFSVRAASALFGVISIVALYFFTVKFFSDLKNKKMIAFLAALFLAIMPWHIILSRTATENSIVTFLILLGFISILNWAKKRSVVWLIFSFLIFGSTYFFYQSPRAFVPLIVPIGFFLLSDSALILKNKWKLIFLYVAILIVPVFLITQNDNLNTRIRMLSVFNDPGVVSRIQDQIARDGVSGLPYLATRLFHNKYINYSQVIFENYFSHFSYSFLFSDQIFPERYKIPNLGMTYLIQLPFIVYGLVTLLRKKTKKGLFLISWIALAPLGSSLTFDDTQNIQRTLFVTPAIAIVSSYGLLRIIGLLKSKFLKRAVVGFVLIVSIYSFGYFLVQYFYQAPYYRTWYRQDGYKTLIETINRNERDYQKVVITNRESAPTIFLWFFSKFDPIKAQRVVSESNIKDTDRMSFDKYQILQEECPLRLEKDEKGIEKLIGEKNTLYVNSSLCKIEELPQEVKLLSTIYRKDGSKVFYLLKVE